MAVFLIITLVAALGWGIYGYMKGAPHGLGAQGVKASLTGIFGMRKLNEAIAAKQAADARAAKTAE